MKAFSIWVQRSPACIRYVLICVVIACVYYVVQRINQRTGVADFEVYYHTAEQWLDGRTPYRPIDSLHHHAFTHGPVTLIPFALLSVLPMPLASGVYYFLVLLAFISFSLLLVWWFEREFGMPVHARGWVLTIITCILADHLERELHLGNLNIFLLSASFGLFAMWRNGNSRGAGWIYAAILFFKPQMLVLLPFFIWKKEWSMLGTAAIGLVAGFFIPVVISGWNNHLAFTADWFHVLREHHSHLFHSPNTFFGMWNNWVLQPLRQSSGLLWLTVIASAIVLALWLIFRRSNREETGIKPLFIQYFILIALIPNLTCTDTEHFMWTWPLIAWIVSVLWYFPVLRNGSLMSLFVLALIPYSFNSPDLVGRRAMLFLDESGVLGLSNVLLIFIAFRLYTKFIPVHLQSNLSQ